jgi:hypothetical protein
VAEVTSAAPPTQLGVKASGNPEARRLKPEKSAVAVSRFGSPGHPHGERQQFDNQVVENASERGLAALFFRGDIEEPKWKVWHIW